MRRSFIVLALLLGQAVHAVEALPEPLSLQQALQIARSHPSIAIASARLEQANASSEQIAAENDLNIDFEGDLTYVDPVSITPDQSNDDSKLFLRFSSKLYDFGYTDARLAAADMTRSSRQWSHYDVTQQHLLKVAGLFFNVLLADKAYAVADERMTVAFLKYDKTRDRHDLGTISDVDLLELENDYRQKLQIRRQTEHQQRNTRMKLAASLGRPDELPSNLVPPEVDWKQELPSVDEVVAQIIANNPGLKALNDSVSAAKQQLTAAQASDNPVIRGEMQFADYQRLTGSSHPFTVGLVLEAPLYSGGKSQADEKQARSLLLEQEAKLNLAKLEIREQALEVLLELEQYKTDIDAALVSEDYIELYLDRSRALYELEVASDLGDALSRSSDVIYQKLKARLGFALAQMKLAALQGQWQETADSKPSGENHHEATLQ